MNHWHVVVVGMIAMAVLFGISVPQHASDIQARIAKSLSYTMGKGSRKNVDYIVDGRYVTLTGTVETEKVRNKAEFFASRPRLVSAVDNQIKVVAPSS